ncbi:hypothetical protein CAEBREN_18899 [Caenorhabditis brenneri]|uniref:Protein yippee-like n=1 Tax=Caenorhabditis brenneri TaxID=135651 RepID=G0N278_CAEBE|nr:hypothetical protein CAEBREN_18899 [Caenorhabditis brenneri]
MGKKFIGVQSGRGELWGCKSCHTYITCLEELTSTAFNGSTGPARLYKRAWNVSHGALGKREMTTGLHIVRDIFCVTCNKKLGWMYEQALVQSQTYKEGQVILEDANMIRISLEIKDPLGEDVVYRPPTPNIETSRRHRTSSEITNRTISESAGSSSSDFQDK